MAGGTSQKRLGGINESDSDSSKFERPTTPNFNQRSVDSNPNESSQTTPRHAFNNIDVNQKSSISATAAVQKSVLKVMQDEVASKLQDCIEPLRRETKSAISKKEPVVNSRTDQEMIDEENLKQVLANQVGLISPQQSQPPRKLKKDKPSGESSQTSGKGSSVGKKCRHRLNYQQISILEGHFQLGHNWSSDQVDEMAGRLDVPRIKIYKWNWDRKKRILANAAASAM